MFIGHYAVGMAAKKVAPGLNLGLLFIACQWLDHVWPIFVLLGIEKVRVDHHATVVTPLDFQYYPFSHSLLMTVVWAVLLGGAYLLIKKNFRNALILGAVVMSHWVLDWITHRPDMPISLDGVKVGLGLWNSLYGLFMIEVSLFAGGIILFLKSRNRPSKNQQIGFWVLIVFMSLIYLGNIFGLKPPEDTSPLLIAGPALALWLFVLGAWAVDSKSGKGARKK